MVSALCVHPVSHLAFVTKYRRGVPGADMLRRCEDAMRKLCSDLGRELREFNGEDNHVHLLVKYPPKVTVAGLVNSLKGLSARRLRAAPREVVYEMATSRPGFSYFDLKNSGDG